MIVDFVKAIVDKHIAVKEQKGVFPACCSRTEIITELMQCVTDAMRQLHQSGQYVGSLNVNKVPTLTKKQ